MRDPPPAPAPPARSLPAAPPSEAVELEIGALEATLPPLPAVPGTPDGQPHRLPVPDVTPESGDEP